MVDVYVGFGEEPEQGECTELYSFPTKAEADAFKLGLRTGITWFEAHCYNEERCYSTQKKAWLPAPEYIELSLTEWST